MTITATTGGPSGPAVRQRQRPARALDTTASPVEAAGSREGHLSVTRTRYGSEPEALVSERIHVPVFATQPAYVSVRAKETINMGDFNNVSVEVSLMLPCLPEASELERVYQMSSDVVERWMDREIKRATDPTWEGHAPQA